ncbi:MAG: hypothetical protein WA139_00580 [Candidatus Aenigmatarchaeota archaeon]
MSWDIDEYPILYAVKATLPENTYPNLNMTYISGPFMDVKGLFMSYGPNGKREHIGDFSVFGNLRRPGEVALFNNRYALIFPQLPLPSKSLYIETFPTEVNVSIGWERPALIKFLWIVSFFAIIAFTLLMFSRKIDVKNYIIYSFTIWGFQEGINQFIPSARPLYFTVFEIPILIPLIVVSLYAIYKILLQISNYYKYKNYKIS